MSIEPFDYEAIFLNLRFARRPVHIWPMNLLVLATVACAVLISGCANPINARTSEHYYYAGKAAEERGDLVRARICYDRCAVNTVVGFLGPAAQAHALYDWCRVSGYLGKYEDAERGFSNVLHLIEKAKPKAETLLAPALCEYARLLHDTGKHEKAIELFERAVPELDGRNAEHIDPISMADFLDDYAASLRASGRSDAPVMERARSIRDANPGATAKRKYRRYVGK